MLDRQGHPLAATIPATLDTSRRPPLVLADLPLASLARADDVLELTISAGEKVEQKLTAFRVK